MQNQLLSSLLTPFVRARLSTQQLEQLSIYLELLTKWNDKMNLTSVRSPLEMVTRHFGESLFAAAVLGDALKEREKTSLLDFGSGAGFPGLPVKIALPELQVTLAESQMKKAMFLREVIRTLGLNGIEVHANRAEDLSKKFDVVAMRAVDGQESLLQPASTLLRSGGLMLLMLGTKASETSTQALPDFKWAEPVLIPDSKSRIVLIGTKHR